MANTTIRDRSRVVQILTAFSSADGGAIKDIYSPGLVSPWMLTNAIRWCGFIRSLRATIKISSIEEPTFPDYNISESKTKRFLDTRDMQWKSPRKELHLFLRNSRCPLTFKAAISLMAIKPYYEENLMSYLGDDVSYGIADDTVISAAIVDVGYGHLTGNDTVLISGYVKEQADEPSNTTDIASISTPYSWSIGNSSSVILSSNPNRKGAIITNTFRLENAGVADVWLNKGPIAEIGKGIHLVKGSGCYEINSTNLYKGPISAIAENDTVLYGEESV